MLNWLICKIIGHKKYKVYNIECADMLTIKDSLGANLVSINVCKRCGAVYSDLYE